MAIVKAIPEMLPLLKSQIPVILEAIVQGVIDGVPDMLEAGKELIKGLWQGISDMAGWIGEKIRGFGDGVLDSLKSFFGIHSPSTVMENIIGKNLALGIGEGFEKNIKGVNSEIQNALNFESPTVNVVGRVRAGVGAGAGAGKSIVINQTNNYSQEKSRYEIWQSKQDIAAAVRLVEGGATS